MAATINWTVGLQVPSGPQHAKSGALSVDAYDKLDVTVADGDSDKEVELQPGGDVGQVMTLAILTDQPSTDLTYKVNDDGADPIPLDQPMQLYLGAGQVALLDPAAGPTKFFFSNASGKSAVVQIFIGRKATS